MKEKIEISIRKNILEEIYSRLSKKDINEFDDIVEDSLMKYLDIKINDITNMKYGKNVVYDIDVLNSVNNAYYVYVFMDPTIKKKTEIGINNIILPYEAFYIGKGKGNRMDFLERNDDVNERILGIKSKGLECITIKIKEGLRNLESHKLECYLINKIGRLDNNTGTLLNKSGGLNFVDLESVEYDFTELNLEKNIGMLIINTMNSSKTLKISAKKLGIAERTLYRKIRELNIVFENGRYLFKK